MPDRKPPESASEFLDGLVELFTNLPDRTMEELEEDLREEGVDPETFAQRVRELVESELEEQRLAWFEHARQGRGAALERLREVQPSSTLSTLKEVKQKVKAVLAGQYGPDASEFAYAQLHHRNLDDVTESDLRSLLDDLERLKLLTQLPGTDENQDK